ncbi:Rap1a/Tai family immunity protein [Massilia sp. LjRoot122]|uniref:Rap1a/Tai family immunity protein n=1 Tax=Massilia sp. LjRoot122 TaxID=3342257 RepID=UPI003ECE401F
MRALFFASLLSVAPSWSQNVSQAPWMTGERFLSLVAFPPIQGKSSLQVHVDEQRARMYIHGVHDATEGKGWCYGQPYKPKPDVLEDAVIDGIKGLSPEQLKRNAADLFVEIWRVKYPCQSGKDKS